MYYLWVDTGSILKCFRHSNIHSPSFRPMLQVLSLASQSAVKAQTMPAIHQLPRSKKNTTLLCTKHTYIHHSMWLCMLNLYQLCTSWLYWQPAKLSSIGINIGYCYYRYTTIPAGITTYSPEGSTSFRGNDGTWEKSRNWSASWNVKNAYAEENIWRLWSDCTHQLTNI